MRCSPPAARTRGSGDSGAVDSGGVRWGVGRGVSPAGALHIHASLDPGFVGLVIREIGALAAFVLAIDAARLDHLLIVILRLFALCRAGGCLVLLDRALRGLTAQILIDTPVGGIELRLIVGRRGGGVLVWAVAFDELGARRPVIAVLDVPLRVHPLPDVLRVRAARRESAREDAGCKEAQLNCYVSAHGGRPQVRQQPSQGRHDYGVPVWRYP